VEIFKGQNNFRSIKENFPLYETFVLDQVEEKRAASFEV
jgi:hypothetical protein